MFCNFRYIKKRWAGSGWYISFDINKGLVISLGRTDHCFLWDRF